jgi:hypothetical protein
LGNLRIDGSLILNWVLKKDGVDRDRGPVAGCCGHDDEPSCSVKGGDFLGQLSGYKLLKVGAAPALQRLEMGTSVLRMSERIMGRLSFFPSPTVCLPVYIFHTKTV